MSTFRVIARVTAGLAILAGVAIGGLMAYELWGTSMHTRAAQSSLERDWDEQAAGSERAKTPAMDPSSEGQEDTGGSRAAGPVIHGRDPAVRDTALEAASVDVRDAPAVGDAVLRIDMVRPETGERVVLDEPLVVVEGVGAAELALGPGRYEHTVMPGQPGTAAIAGHRVTYGAPFNRLDELAVDDEIHVTDLDGQEHVYRMVEQQIVRPEDTWVLDDPLDSSGATLVLTTCHPKYSQRERLVVFAELVG